MSVTQETPRQNAFTEQELVTWHYHEGNRLIPIPAVVVRQEQDGVIIKARIQGAMKELRVDPRQVVER